MRSILSQPPDNFYAFIPRISEQYQGKSGHPPQQTGHPRVTVHEGSANGQETAVDKMPDGEPQHLAGTQPRHWLRRVGPTEQRVLGMPLSWYRFESVDLSGWCHPIQWTKWRITSRRLGPYAPDFEQYMTPRP
jgi:hypothetical protein